MRTVALQRQLGLAPLLIVFLVAVAAWSLYFPALNWPDEAYKIDRIGVDSNPYLQLMATLVSDNCQPQYSFLPVQYVSNKLSVELLESSDCYFRLKIANVGLIAAMVGSCLLLLRVPGQRRLLLLSLIWPANLFYMTGINQQTVFSVLSVTIVVSAIYAPRVWPHILISIALLAIDRSFASLTMFLGLLMLTRWQARNALLVFLALIIVAYLLRPYIDSFTVLIGNGKTIGELSQGLLGREDSIFISLGLLFVSFVYLGGTNTVLGFGIDYAIVLIVILYLLLKNWHKPELRVYLGAFIMTYFVLISIVPTLQTFRYYVFVMPAIIYFLLESQKSQTVYIAYCGIMSLAYLLKAGFLHV